MKSAVSKITFIILLTAFGCSERSLFTDPTDPGLGGFYTILSGEVSGKLLKSKSPYYATADIKIAAGSTLTIEPGTIIFFKQKTGLNIYGGLKALGIKDNPVVFRSVTYEWNGIHSTNPTDSVIFIFCKIVDVYLPIGSQFRDGGVEINNANLVVRNCYFSNNYSNNGGGLALTFCNSEIVNNIFYFNDALDYGGAILSKNSRNKIINNTFYDNYCSSYGGAITLADPVHEEIQNNIFYKNFSYLADSRIYLVSGDSSNVFEQYNYMDPDSLNPLFISSTDFHLQQNSPCKNAGNPSPEFNDADGSRNDQGAYGGPGGNW
jgi:hypothetical protein